MKISLVFEAFNSRTGAVVHIGTSRKCRNAVGNARTMLVRRMQPMTPGDLGLLNEWETLAANGFWQPSAYDYIAHCKLWWY